MAKIYTIHSTATIDYEVVVKAESEALAKEVVAEHIAEQLGPLADEVTLEVVEEKEAITSH